MIIPSARLQDFRSAIEEAASFTATDLSQSGSFPWDLRVARAALCCLAEFPERAIFCNEEMMASVLVRHRGSLPGTSVISFHPQHALDLIGSLGVDENPIDVFRSAGASVLRGVLGRIGGKCGSPIEFGDPILEERALVATVLGTHPPPETMVVSLEVGFVSADRAFPAYLYMLLDVKALQSALGCVGEGEGGTLGGCSG